MDASWYLWALDFLVGVVTGVWICTRGGGRANRVQDIAEMVRVLAAVMPEASGGKRRRK